MSYDAPFAGLKVVDLSQGIAGPYCAMLLAQHGADVIKVEGIGEGDWARTLGRALRQPLRLLDHRQSRQAQHRRRSQERGRQGRCVWRLLQGADVFLEGFRPGVIRRLGFDYEAVSAREPRLLYVAISGFGQTGPLAERPAMDPVLQAYTGLMAENRGEDGIPHRVPVIVVDMSTGLYAFQGAVGRALCAPRRAARPLHRCQPDAGGDGAAVDPPDGLPSRRRRDEARRRAGRRVQDRRRLDVDPRHQRPRLAQPVRRRWSMPALADDPRFVDARALRLANEVALYAIVRPAIAARTSADMERAADQARS